MSEHEMARLAEHAKAHPEFLERFRQDPVNTSRGAGYSIEKHEEAAMEKEDFAELSDEDVIGRISMFWMIGP